MEYAMMDTSCFDLFWKFNYDQMFRTKITLQQRSFQENSLFEMKYFSWKRKKCKIFVFLFYISITVLYDPLAREPSPSTARQDT